MSDINKLFEKFKNKVVMFDFKTDTEADVTAFFVND